MSAREYRDDDAGYLNWRDKNPRGYVLNIHRSHNPVDAHLHDVGCSSLIAPIGSGLKLTDQYVKVCGRTEDEVHEWAGKHLSEPIPDCMSCRDIGPNGVGSGHNQRDTRMCPQCSMYQLSVTGNCPSCDED
ncbi:hypothetical protein [Mycobacterium paragordonae]|uniref:Uncharacterized protein n=1 Tax=Mycobacterium paragordonae TaxID=1389713 RepID=A0A4R5WY77_9MYCO|nr:MULTISPECIES: hypothetical protein [Mycobacterium]MDP7733987.1 hypothetical protein [Mycobacterium paragordonae]TDL00799.1 hypothetical protein EUA02_05715 [Mycobacterium paragordonae]TDL09270.1 hypothetical protein EUA05_06675 [Mycobacterium paragordonae]